MWTYKIAGTSLRCDESWLTNCEGLGELAEYFQKNTKTMIERFSRILFEPTWTLASSTRLCSKKATTALMIGSSVREFFPTCLAAANFFCFCDEECLISKAGDWPSKGLRCFRWRHHYQNVDGFVKHMKESFFTKSKNNDFAVWILKWVAFDCKRRMALFFSLNLTMRFTAACNSQFGWQKNDMKFLGRDITLKQKVLEVLKVKPLRVMPKGLSTTWPINSYQFLSHSWHRHISQRLCYGPLKQGRSCLRA